MPQPPHSTHQGPDQGVSNSFTFTNGLSVSNIAVVANPDKSLTITWNSSSATIRHYRLALNNYAPSVDAGAIIQYYITEGGISHTFTTPAPMVSEAGNSHVFTSGDSMVLYINLNNGTIPSVGTPMSNNNIHEFILG